jgi:Ni,Fe-hydrogenase III large subunit
MIRDVAARAWRDACREAVSGGARFAGLHASGRPADTVTALFLDPDSRALLLRSPIGTDRSHPSIVDIVPAADWDQREAHDLGGVAFDGHEPLRPLVEHPADPAAWTVPVVGPDTHQVAVGPIHAGVIESGHFRFHVVGERILLVDLRLFHKHRGLELSAEGQAAEAGLAIAQRACAACSVANGVAYAQAVESARGLEPDRDLRRSRTLLLELERVYNHLHDLSAVCAGIGFTAGTMAFAALKERAQRLNAELCGHRFLFGTVAIASSAIAVTAAQADAAQRELLAIGQDAARTWHEVDFNPSVSARLAGVGTLTRADALLMGAVGPTARASGVPLDARSHGAGLWYTDHVPAIPDRPIGDVAARVAVRSLEVERSIGMLFELLADPVGGGSAQAGGSLAVISCGVVESPRGQTACVVELEDNVIRRLRLRTASYANWPLVAHVSAGEILPEFPLINKSFELCYACVDR